MAKTEKKAAGKGEIKKPQPGPAQSQPRAGKPNVKHIPLKDIIGDPKQPRKHYNQLELDQLAASITKHDVLQAITVREIPGNAGKYMVVFGERRMRASAMAGKYDIEAKIVVMTDLEAREAQVIENSQRANVHPMEEAPSLKELLDSIDGENITARQEAVGAMIGKSRKYVAIRVQLCELLDEFQQLFVDDRIPFVDAVQLSRQPHDIQVMVRDNKLPKNWEKNTNPISWNLSYFLNDKLHKLKGAPFKLTDAKIYPEMGACTNCPFNSATKLELFAGEDEKLEATCSNGKCFNIKCDRAIKAKIENVMSNPDLTLIVIDSYMNDREKKELQAVLDTGVSVLYKGRHFTEPYDLDEPGTWEEYYKENYDEDYNDYRGVEITAEDYEKELAKDYAEALENYAEERKKRDAAIAAGHLKKGYIVAGDGKGKTIDIQLKIAGAAKTEGASIDEQAAAIMQRVEQSEGKDAEKVWAQVRKLIPDELPEQRKDVEPLPEEIGAFYVSVYNKLGYSEQDEFAEFVGAKRSALDKSGSWPLFYELDERQVWYLFRLSITSHLTGAASDHKASITNHGGYQVAKALFPLQLAAIEDGQKQIADKRRHNAGLRVEALKRAAEKATKTEATEHNEDLARENSALASPGRHSAGVDQPADEVTATEEPAAKKTRKSRKNKDA